MPNQSNPASSLRYQNYLENPDTLKNLHKDSEFYLKIKYMSSVLHIYNFLNISRHSWTVKPSVQPCQQILEIKTFLPPPLPPPWNKLPALALIIIFMFYAHIITNRLVFAIVTGKPLTCLHYQRRLVVTGWLTWNSLMSPIPCRNRKFFITKTAFNFLMQMNNIFNVKCLFNVKYALNIGLLL